MTTIQKIIKYLAIGFAMALTVAIISTILSVFHGLSGVLGLKKEDENVNIDMSEVQFENSDVAILDIDLSYTNLTIKTGETLKAEASNNKIQCTQNDKKLKIVEEYEVFSKNDREEMIVYVPEDLEFEKVKINTGAGKINIQNLTAKELVFELGAGETQIENLNVSDKCEIEGGIGKLNIAAGSIKDLDLDMGVGELNMTAKLTGENKVNAGVGNLKMNLKGDKENYKIDTDKGIGSVKIDGQEISDDEKYGDGENSIDVDGGIGSIKIDFVGE